MPKMKTRKAAAKRFTKTGSGKYKRQHAYTSHMQRNKSQKQKRNLRHSTIVAKADEKRIKRMLND